VLSTKSNVNISSHYKKKSLLMMIIVSIRCGVTAEDQWIDADFVAALYDRVNLAGAVAVVE